MPKVLPAVQMWLTGGFDTFIYQVASLYGWVKTYQFLFARIFKKKLARY